jgi:hypothetical protein
MAPRSSAASVANRSAAPRLFSTRFVGTVASRSFRASGALVESREFSTESAYFSAVSIPGASTTIQLVFIPSQIDS